MRGLASKSTTTWFLAGRDGATEFIRFHFEIVNTIQLTFSSVDQYNHAFTWYINTAYIMAAPSGGSVCRTFLDTSATTIESQTTAASTVYIQQVSTLPVVAIAGV